MKFKVSWLGLLLVAGACRGGDDSVAAASDAGMALTGAGEAVRADIAHAQRLRDLYRAAGLAEPGPELLGLPLCRATVAVGAGDGVQQLACEVPSVGLELATLVRVGDEAPQDCSAQSFEIANIRIAGRIVPINAAQTTSVEADADGFVRWSWDVKVGAREVVAPSLGTPIELPFAMRLSPACAAGVASDDGYLPGPAEWLVLKGASTAVHWLLEFHGPSGVAAVLPGVALPGPREQGTRHFRPASVRTAMAWGRDLAFTTLDAGRQAIRAALPTSGSADIAALLPRVRRAHEVFDRQFPSSAPQPDTVVFATRRLPPLAIAADGGLVAIGLPNDDVPMPDFAALIQAGDMAALIEGILRAHPLRRDSLEYHVLTAIAENRLDRAAASDFGARVLVPGFSGAIALRIIRESGGDKAMRRARELSLVFPFQFGMLRGAAEPVLTRASNQDDDALMRIKASLLVDSLWKNIGNESGWRLVARIAAGEITDRDGFEKAVAEVAPIPDDARALIGNGLDQTLLGDALGAPSVANLLEYVVVDGGIDMLKSELLKGAATNPDVIGAGVGLLGGGRLQLDPLLDLVEGAAAGRDGGIEPWFRKAVDVGRLVLGSDGARRQATDRLVEELGAELGLDEKRRSNLKWIAEEAFKAMRSEPDQDGDPAVVPGPKDR